ncbi:hypothetical protein GTA09_21160 [Rhodococcus hoagii]|nr:hypothetical protein [Prescottella equi]
MSAMWLSGLDGAAPMAIVTFVFLSLLVWFGKLATASLHAEILEKNRTDAAGFDIIARHDPVSSALEFWATSAGSSACRKQIPSCSTTSTISVTGSFSARSAA